MAELKSEYHDRRILENIAEVESEERPFSHKTAGVEYEDIIDNFVLEDYGKSPVLYVPRRMDELAKNDYLTKVYDGGSNTVNAYRLTSKEWKVVDEPEPDTPVEDLD